MKVLKYVAAPAILAILAIYIVSCVIIPRFHKKADPNIIAQSMTSPADLGPASERVLCVDDNEQALIWRLRVIEEAKEDLVMTTFDFGDDEGGRDIMAALYHAADRGVKVRIIVDGINGFLNLSRSESYHALAAHENVEARLYNPIRLYAPWRLNYRMHDKYIVADETVFILGGRNTNNLFLGNFQKDQNIDRDIVVYSPVPHPEHCLHQVRDYFEQVWSLPHTKKTAYSNRGLEQGRLLLEKQYKSLQTSFPEAFDSTDWASETMPTNGVKLLSNPVEAKNKEPVLWETLISLMQGAEQCTVQTPYIICSRGMYDDLSSLTKAGKQVDVIINAIESGANPWGCTDYLNQKKKIQSTGIHTYEYLGPTSSHTKTVLLDDRYSVVGSFNFDMRSAYLDTELMLFIDCPELNQQLRRMAEDDMSRSKHVFPDGSVQKGSEYNDVAIGTTKRILYGFIRVFSIPFRPLL